MSSFRKEIRVVENLIKPKRYLEVGISTGDHLLSVDADYKVGIDINPKIPENFPIKVYIGSSDSIFNSPEFKQEKPFDLIFIDAFHEYNQVVRDVKNALKYLTSKGIIICHDVYPFDRLNIPNLTNKEPPSPTAPWTGDTWKVVFYVRWFMPKMQYCVVKNFPGYLYLWKSHEVRPVSRMEMKSRTGKYFIGQEDIDKLTDEWGANNTDLMNIVELDKIDKVLNG